MKKKAVLFLMIIFLLCAANAFAQYTNDKDTLDDRSAPSGMVTRKVNNDVTILLPKGARMQKRNDTTYVEESSDEYAARNFLKLENRIARLENENKALRQEIDDIRFRLNQVIQTQVKDPAKDVSGNNKE